MSRFIRFKHSCLGVLIAGIFVAAPSAASAAAVDLGTAGPFVVLGGASVTNTGPSVLNGELGVSPGTSLTGFGLPAVVNGATHQTDSVANIAQGSLTTAYNVAAAEPVLVGNDLTGQDLGGLTLTPGTYGFSSSAGLTGALTLDALGDPNAQFVFKIGSTLTTASASSVLLVNGASPCNVYWQVGSSATLGSTTAFQGNLMTLADITLNNGASVLGRVLARTAGAITLDNNVLTNPGCATGSSGGSGGTGGTAGAGNSTPPASTSLVLTRLGTATLRQTPGTGSSRQRCTEGFSATVRGRQIKRVVFSLDGRRIAVRTSSPATVRIRALAGRHTVSARITFLDATSAVTRRLRYRACAAAVLSPRPGSGGFTG